MEYIFVKFVLEWWHLFSFAAYQGGYAPEPLRNSVLLNLLICGQDVSHGYKCMGGQQERKVSGFKVIFV